MKDVLRTIGFACLAIVLAVVTFKAGYKHGKKDSENRWKTEVIRSADLVHPNSNFFRSWTTNLPWSNTIIWPKDEKQPDPRDKNTDLL